MAEPPLFEAPLNDLLPVAPPPVRPQAFSDPTSGPGAVVHDRPDAELWAVGRAQRRLVGLVLLRVLLVAGGLTLVLGLRAPPGTEGALLPVLLVVAADFAIGLAALVVFLVLAAQLYRPPVVVLLGLCQLVPVVGLVALLAVNARATAELRRNGVRVGLLGARRADLRVLAPPPRRRSDGRLPKLGW